MTQRKGLLLALAIVLIGIGAWLVAPSHLSKINPPSPPDRSVANATGGVTKTGSSKPSSQKHISIQGKTPYRSAQPAPPPAGPLKDNIADMERRAKSGDSAMAYTLALQLLNCRQLDREYAEVQKQLSTRDLTPDNAKESLSSLDSKMTDCAGLTPAQMDSYAQWVEFAASNGDVSAQTTYTDLVSPVAQAHAAQLDTQWIDDYKNNSLSFLQSAASSGNVDAISRLSMAYWDGYLTPQDKRMAYAYMQCAAATGLITSARGTLNYFSQSMTPDEVGGALSQARSICE